MTDTVNALRRFAAAFKHGYFAQKQIRLQNEFARNTAAESAKTGDFRPLLWTALLVVFYLALICIVFMVLAAIVKWSYVTLFG
jgi:hypothetical protein